MPNSYPATNRPPAERRQLPQEIAIALSIKIILLAALWFAVFRPSHQSNTLDALFASPATPSSTTDSLKSKEQPHDHR